MIRNGKIDILIRNNANTIDLLEPNYDASDDYTITFDDILGNKYGDARVITTIHSSNKEKHNIKEILPYPVMRTMVDSGLRAGLFVVDDVTYNVIVLGSSKDDPLNRKWAKSVSIK